MPEDIFGGFYQGGVVECEEVYGRFCVVVAGVVNGGGFSVSVLFCAYSVDVRLFPWAYKCFGDVEEILMDAKGTIISLDCIEF